MNVEKEKVKHFFNNLEYGTKKKEFYMKSLFSKIISVVPLKNKSVLDTGCGEGDFLFRAEPFISKGVGLDISTRMINIGRKKNKSRKLSFRVGDAENLPFNSKQYDIVVSIDLLEHLSNSKKAILEACRVSKEKCILITGNPLWFPMFWLLEFLHLKLPEGPHHWVGADEISNVSRIVGAEIELNTTFFPFPILDKFSIPSPCKWNLFSRY